MRGAAAALLLLAACSPDAPTPVPGTGTSSPAARPLAKVSALPGPDAAEREAAARLAASTTPEDLRDVLMRFPGTAAARTAAGRLRDRHGASRPAAAPASAPDPLAPRNAARAAFNAAAARARALDERGDAAGAAAALAAVPRDADPDVAAAVDRALAALRRSGTARAERREADAGAAAWQEVRDRLLPALGKRLQARRYAEAMLELDAAAKRPSLAPLQDALADERAAIAEAASFWDAFLKALAARAGQDVSLPLAGGKRASGRLVRVQDGKLLLEGEPDLELSALHEDAIVGWTLGRAWPASDGASYVKAALFFHAEGRDELAARYLATAKELNAPAEGAERVFREGLIRQLRPDPPPAPEPREKPKKP